MTTVLRPDGFGPSRTAALNDGWSFVAFVRSDKYDRVVTVP